MIGRGSFPYRYYTHVIRLDREMENFSKQLLLDAWGSISGGRVIGPFAFEHLMAFGLWFSQLGMAGEVFL